eukprot:scaffold129383_cov51-Phaeocystis_antarctica.AAC.2
MTRSSRAAGTGATAAAPEPRPGRCVVRDAAVAVAAPAAPTAAGCAARASAAASAAASSAAASAAAQIAISAAAFCFCEAVRANGCVRAVLRASPPR